MSESVTFELIRDAVLLPGEQSHEERAADVLRLADLNDKRVPDTLIAFFRNPDLPLPVRVAAGTALEMFRFRGWIPDLLSVLRSTEPREIREAAAYALRLMVDNPAVADALIAVLLDRKQPAAVSAAAAAALYHEALFDYPEMTTEIVEQKILPTLQTAAEDVRLPVRAAAIYALRLLERTELLPAVVLTESDVADLANGIIHPETPPENALHFIALLGESGHADNEMAIAALVALLEDEELDDATRIAAAEECGHLGSSLAVSSLVRLLESRFEAVKLRTAAASGLGGIRDREAFIALARLAADTSDEIPVRARAALALTQRQDRNDAWEAELPAVLLSLLTDPLADIRGVAAEGLGDVGEAEVVPYLENLRNDEATADFLPVTWWRVADAAEDALRRICQRAL